MRDRKKPPHPARPRSGSGPGARQGFGPDRKSDRRSGPKPDRDADDVSPRSYGGGDRKRFGDRKPFRKKERDGAGDRPSRGEASEVGQSREPRPFRKDFREPSTRRDGEERRSFEKRGPRRDGQRHDRRRFGAEAGTDFADERGGRSFGSRPDGKRRLGRDKPNELPRPSSFRSEYGREDRGRDEGKRRHEGPGEHPGALWIYGRHAALAAIRNEARKIKRVLAADSGLEWLNEADLSAERRALIVKVAPFEIDRALHAGAVHQGIAVEVEALPRARLRETCAPEGAMRPVVVFDQITDPHNIGAIFRSAAAFGARAVIVQDRRTPPLAGALAKAAAGAVESVPCIEVVNIARALEGLKDLGYFCAGLDGDATKSIAEIPRDRPVALVLGAEGAGLRRLVGETCDETYRIALDPGMDSLNVSNAAAVALYEVTRNPHERV